MHIKVALIELAMTGYFAQTAEVATIVYSLGKHLKVNMFYVICFYFIIVVIIIVVVIIIIVTTTTTTDSSMNVSKYINLK